MKRIILFSILLGIITPIQPAFAEFGISNLQISNQNPKSNEIITVEFELNRAISVDQKYQIAISFLSLRDGFFGVADLYEGNYSKGKWKAKILIPGNIYSGDFTITFKPIGSQENNKDQISAGSRRIGLNITGKPVPTPPVIEVLNIKTDKQAYSGGSIIRVTFETKILAGIPNEETSNPEVKLWDIRFNSYLRPTTNHGKPIVASGNYALGKWTLDYPIEPFVLNSTAQIYVTTPRGYDLPGLVTKGEIIQIQGLVNEIKISNVTLDKKYYEPNSKVRVTFSTSAKETTLNSSNKPFIVLTDLENTDLSENIETTLLSGTLGNGEWAAEFFAPEISKFTPPKNSYLLGFYNSSRTIRDIGPELVIRKNQKLEIVDPKTLRVDSNISQLNLEISSLSGLPIQNSALTPDICSVSQNKVSFLAAGKCEIFSLSLGNDEWAETSIKTTITKSIQSTTIVCINGKLSKRVTAVKPKCPTGYKKKV